MINMEAIPKFDIKSVIKFDISIKPTTWIGHKILYFYTEPFFKLKVYDEMFEKTELFHFEMR